jgi:peroxiredoxin
MKSIFFFFSWFLLIPLQSQAEKAPLFSLNGINQTSYSLEQYKGKKILLHFWSPTCFICPAEVKILNKLHSRSNLRIITIMSFDTSTHSINQARAMELDIPVLLDVDGDVAQKFNVSVLPVTFLIDEDGEFLQMNDPSDLSKKSHRFDGPRDWLSADGVRAIKEISK